MSTSRKYDIVVYGATGFTGELTCEYLLEIKDKSLKWAMAGRSLSKLEKVRENLSKTDEAAKDLDLIVADASKPETLDAFLKDTTVVLSTVGPFALYGTPLVEACLRQKTHYVDTTGEYNWIYHIINQFHEKAKQENIMIVPTCGFDSVPSDLGTFMVVDYIKRKHNLSTAEVKGSYVDVVGGASGGTLQTTITSLADKSLTKDQSFDPYLLASERGIAKPYLPSLHKDHDFYKKWQTFFVMSVINEKVVHRSWSLQNERGQGYGRLFKYREYMALSFIKAFLVTSFFFATMPLGPILFKIGWIYRAAQKLLPSAGTGPSLEQRMKGKFELQIVATAETEPYDSPVRARGYVKAFGDPGYRETCRMVAESALCIVRNLDSLPGKEGGILTPATAFGQVLIDRLTATGGMIFEVKDIEN
ncbi:unnamed protein product [Cunninghamella blakesleeana]